MPCPACHFEVWYLLSYLSYHTGSTRGYSGSTRTFLSQTTSDIHSFWALTKHLRKKLMVQINFWSYRVCHFEPSDATLAQCSCSGSPKLAILGQKWAIFGNVWAFATKRNLRLNTKKCGGDKLLVLLRASIWAILLSYISMYKVRLTKWANLVCSRKIPWHIFPYVSEVWRLVSLKYTFHLPRITSASILALEIGYRMEDLDIGVSTFWWNMRIFILGSSKKVLQEVQKYKKN